MKVVNLNDIKRKVERLTCSVHREHPKIRVVGSSLKFECCCEAFATICTNQTQEEMANEAQKSISDMLDKAFKNW